MVPNDHLKLEQGFWKSIYKDYVETQNAWFLGYTKEIRSQAHCHAITCLQLNKNRLISGTTSFLIRHVRYYFWYLFCLLCIISVNLL